MVPLGVTAVQTGIDSLWTDLGLKSRPLFMKNGQKQIPFHRHVQFSGLQQKIYPFPFFLYGHAYTFSLSGSPPPPGAKIIRGLMFSYLRMNLCLTVTVNMRKVQP